MPEALPDSSGPRCNLGGGQNKDLVGVIQAGLATFHGLSANHKIRGRDRDGDSKPTPDQTSGPNLPVDHRRGCELEKIKHPASQGWFERAAWPRPANQSGYEYANENPRDWI